MYIVLLSMIFNHVEVWRNKINKMALWISYHPSIYLYEIAKRRKKNQMIFLIRIFMLSYFNKHTFWGELDIVAHVETCFQHLIIIPITKPSSYHGLIITTTYYLISRFNKYLQQEYIISVFFFCFHSINLVVQKILMFISYVHGCNIIYIFL